MYRKRNAFTLVEILIVVVIMAVLAATIIPQFNSSTEDAQIATAVFNLQALRSQIELYKAQHGGNPPDAMSKLANRTNSSGTSGTVAATFPFGPYMLRLPENPFNNLSTVTTVTADPTAPPAGTSGWIYNTANGNVFVDNAEHWQE